MKALAFLHESKTLKALSHPKRLEIVHLLASRELTATDIQRMTGFPQANLSQHLRELKVARVIVAERDSKNIRYRLAHPSFLQISKILQETSAPQKPKSRETKKSEVQDVVCGMWVEPAATKFQTIYKGATYFFCASGCQKHFVKSPETYAKR
jgi:DNA-binding transcriptional ArsR family regulator